MIKCRFENASDLMNGIKILSEDVGIEVVNSSPYVVINAEKKNEAGLSVSLSGGAAKICYGERSDFFRALAILADWLRCGVKERALSEKPIFTQNGAMVDMSRNAVMNLRTVKFMLRKMALMGLNSYMLYTEDTYEIDGRDYFGYMRGRYTKEEIREIDEYAEILGIELIPCIQVLGHLATHLRWQATAPYRDSVNTLLVGSEETYKLIDDMMKTVSECFRSKRLHIGMDETHDLGTGAYLDKNGYRPRQDIYVEHLNRVYEMAKAHGFKPMMWSDMLYRLADSGCVGDYDVNVKITEEFASLIPKGIQQVFWDYYNKDEEFYAINIEKHKMFGDDTVFAGGVWTWSGHCPHFSRSLRHTVPALDACRKGGVKEVVATVWHNGAECSLITSLAGLSWYADYGYRGYYDEEGVRECFERACVGSKYDDFMALEIPELPHGGDVCISRSLLYNDPLIGLIDKHIEGYDVRSYYANANERLAKTECGDECFAPAFNVVKRLSDLLLNKADFGVRLKAAYDSGDRDALNALLLECDEIIKKTEALRISHREAWYEHNKPFGWEVHDIRYGGLIMRFETAKERISSYLSGKISKIEELEAERRYFVGVGNGNKFNNSFLWFSYSRIATVSRL